MTEDLHQIVGELTDAEFEHLYGPLGRITPRDATDLFDGIDAPWWIVGGWAIEAFTGQQREHEDLDVCVLARDVPRLVEHFVKTHHVWATGGGVMSPLLSATQKLPTWMHQIWVRESATRSQASTPVIPGSTTSEAAATCGRRSHDESTGGGS